jgi:hypothetical protein
MDKSYNKYPIPGFQESNCVVLLISQLSCFVKFYFSYLKKTKQNKKKTQSKTKKGTNRNHSELAATTGPKTPSQAFRVVLGFGMQNALEPPITSHTQTAGEPAGTALRGAARGWRDPGRAAHRAKPSGRPCGRRSAGKAGRSVPRARPGKVPGATRAPGHRAPLGTPCHESRRADSGRGKRLHDGGKPDPRGEG